MYFSVRGFAIGFHQILLDEESRPLTAFSYFGHYQCKRLQMGLKWAPETFQRLINNVLTCVKCLVYLAFQRLRK